MDITPIKTPAEQTREVWELFNRFTDKEIETLLNAAGVQPCTDRELRIHQILSVWFHGFIPSLEEVVRIQRENFEKSLDK
jgi:hypothetical protein